MTKKYKKYISVEKITHMSYNIRVSLGGSRYEILFITNKAKWNKEH